MPIPERGLLERIVYGVLLLTVIAVGFFFLAAALIAGAILACIALLRYWWLMRQIRKAAQASVIDTEYTVIEKERLPRA